MGADGWGWLAVCMYVSLSLSLVCPYAYPSLSIPPTPTDNNSFWFNPMTFEWGRVYDDYIRWRKWSSNTGGAVVNSWESWWKDECAYVKKLTVGSKLYLVARSSIWALIGVGLLYGPLFTGTDPSTEREVGRTVFWDAFLLLCLFLTKQGVEAYNPRLRAWQDHHMFLSLFYVLMAILAVKLVCSALFSDVSAFVFVLAGYYVLAFVTTVLFVLDSKLLTTHVVRGWVGG